MTEILLEKNRSKKSENVTNILPIELEGKTRLVNGDSLHDDFSLMAQYDKERDESNRFRFIFVINPICSNVLFNVKTEAYKVVENDGEKYYKIVTDGAGFTRDGDLNSAPINTTQDIDALQIIRDTEYSHPSLGNLKYHCGLDIFNNHILRRNAFCHVNKLRTSVDQNDVFNTFADTLRNNEGNQVSDKIYNENNISMHLYNADTLLSMKNAFLSRCKEQNGWFGFYNSTDLEIPNAVKDGKDVSINRVLMDREPCEFIDLFPDRTYYSFIPQWNEVTNRAEKNWDCFFVYPKYTNPSLLCKILDINGQNNVPLKGVYTIVSSDNKKLLQVRSYVKHNLKVGSLIHIYYSSNGEPSNTIVTSKRGKEIAVESLGDGNGNYKDYVFSISYDDLDGASVSTNSFIFFKRVSNGEECQYYVREFKRLTNENGDNLKSEINKIAFGENIYGDDVAQIMFTDDVNVEGLTDNLGRPVSEVFLTILKRNFGRGLWYNNGIYDEVNADSVERSCHFSKLTAGFDFSGIGDVKYEPEKYNIHTMNNIEPSQNDLSPVTVNTLNSLGDTINKTVQYRERDGYGNFVYTNYIQCGMTETTLRFCGDVVEYDKYECKETVLSEVYHRFNTAQREIFDERYRDVFQDVISRDDYDVKKVNKTEGTEEDFDDSVSPFETSTYYLNDCKSVLHNKDDGDSSDLFYGNICPEGYYYKPFYSVKIRKEKNTKNIAAAKLLTFENASLHGSAEILITPKEKYDFKIGDSVVFVLGDSDKILISSIKKIDGDDVYISYDTDWDVLTNDGKINGNEVKYTLFVKGQIPQYARLLEHSGYFIWRDLEVPSEIARGEELYDTPFMNGCFYIEKNINFFLRRQDPFGKYGLSEPIGSQVMNQITSYTMNAKTNKIDTSVIETIEKGMNVCY